MAEEKQDSQKTIVAFIVGLLIGGMLVWAFSGPESEAPVVTEEESVSEMSEDMDTESDDLVATDAVTSAPALSVGDGSVVVADQPASNSVVLESATYPVSEGWIGVRDYTEGQLGMILGVVRFSESQGLVPDEIVLLRPTTAGREYAVVIYTEDGDFDFNLAQDVQIDEIFTTFTAE